MLFSEVAAGASDVLLDRGIAGAVILILSGFIMYMLKESRAERKESREEATKRAAEHDKHLKENVIVQQELTLAIRELGTHAKQSVATQLKMREDQIRGQTITVDCPAKDAFPLPQPHS